MLSKEGMCVNCVLSETLLENIDGNKGRNRIWW
jgi:hypothetical protein